MKDMVEETGFRGGGLYDIPRQDVSQTSTAITLLACVFASSTLRHISRDFNCVTLVQRVWRVVICDCRSWKLKCNVCTQLLEFSRPPPPFHLGIWLNFEKVTLRHCMNFFKIGTDCRATAQAVSGRLLTAEAPARAHIGPCGICGLQGGIGEGFSQSPSDFPCHCHSTAASYSPCITWGIDTGPVRGPDKQRHGVTTSQ
jgi:hypothetical protein